MTDISTPDTPAPDPIAEATGSDDPQVQRWVQGIAINGDGRSDLPDDETLEAWTRTHAALQRETGDPVFLEGLMGSQFIALHGAAMERIRAARADARPADEIHSDLRLAAAMMSLTTRLRGEIDRTAQDREPRPRPRKRQAPAA